MSKLNKYNEFLNNEEIFIKELIRQGESTPWSDLEAISNRVEYRKVVSLGEKIIPYLLNRLLESGPIWDRALSELTGEGLDPLEYNTTERVKHWEKWASENGY
jgi:hypothetical protein